MVNIVERSAALLAIDSLCGQYPQYSVSLQKLVLKDERFRSICEDYWEAVQAADAQQSDARRQAEFETVAEDLREELFEYLEDCRDA